MLAVSSLDWLQCSHYAIKFTFMTRLPKKRGITQVEEDKSLILRQKSSHMLHMLLESHGEGAVD
jgi:hypothetical protein